MVRTESKYPLPGNRSIVVATSVVADLLDVIVRNLSHTSWLVLRSKPCCLDTPPQCPLAVSIQQHLLRRLSWCPKTYPKISKVGFMGHLRWSPTTHRVDWGTSVLDVLALVLAVRRQCTAVMQ